MIDSNLLEYGARTQWVHMWLSFDFLPNTLHWNVIRDRYDSISNMILITSNFQSHVSCNITGNLIRTGAPVNTFVGLFQFW